MEVPLENQIPLIPVRKTVIFPSIIACLYVGRESSIQAVEEAMKSHRLLLLSTQKDVYEENPAADDIHSIGTVSMLLRCRKLPDGRLKILVQGMFRADYKILSAQPFFQIEYTKRETSLENEQECSFLTEQIKNNIQEYTSITSDFSSDLFLVLDDLQEPVRIVDIVASNIPFPTEDLQKVLEAPSFIERLRIVDVLLKEHIEVMKQNAPPSIKKEEVEKEFPENIFSGEDRSDNKNEEFQDLEEKIIGSKMPEEIRGEALKQLRRLEKMLSDSSEAAMIRGYLDVVANLPWGVYTDDNLDIIKAKAILESHHYGLDEVKERILEFLSVKCLRKDLKGSILCFAGPPGVGKTSLGRTIAQAMGRKYQRVALGGVQDEAEIRGHRRTYVGAMPGKIIQAIKQAGSSNAVILLDEIDKLSNNFRGDPSAAMLEVLDSEQNSTFRDHYLNVDFDLSKTIFIATANVLENIPEPLRDRMEIINISGYTQTEKVAITKQHLIPKALEENGLSKEQVSWKDSEKTLSYLIQGYTKEAGLRSLYREVSSVCRKIVKKIVEEGASSGTMDAKHTVDTAYIQKSLGSPRFIREEKMQNNEIGVATGLAWTPVGGEVLYLEALKSPQSPGVTQQSFKITGQMGDIMKESAQAAWSYINSLSETYPPTKGWFSSSIHIHAPAGAIPKDGPSAGVALSVALLSLMTGNPILKDVAMTGEITLSGRVLPVGGIKEKCLAASYHGIKKILLPWENKRDIEKVPTECLKDIEVVFLKNINEAFEHAFEVIPHEERRGKEKAKAA